MEYDLLLVCLLHMGASKYFTEFPWAAFIPQ